MWVLNSSLSISSEERTRAPLFVRRCRLDYPILHYYRELQQCIKSSRRGLWQYHEPSPRYPNLTRALWDSWESFIDELCLEFQTPYPLQLKHTSSGFVQRCSEAPGSGALAWRYLQSLIALHGSYPACLKDEELNLDYHNNKQKRQRRLGILKWPWGVRDVVVRWTFETQQSHTDLGA